MVKDNYQLFLKDVKAIINQKRKQFNDEVKPILENKKEPFIVGVRDPKYPRREERDTSIIADVKAHNKSVRNEIIALLNKYFPF